jgi:hypothetical protein
MLSGLKILEFHNFILTTLNIVVWVFDNGDVGRFEWVWLSFGFHDICKGIGKKKKKKKSRMTFVKKIFNVLTLNKIVKF